MLFFGKISIPKATSKIPDESRWTSLKWVYLLYLGNSGRGPNQRGECLHLISYLTTYDILCHCGNFSSDILSRTSYKHCHPNLLVVHLLSKPMHAPPAADVHVACLLAFAHPLFYVNYWIKCWYIMQPNIFVMK